LIFFFSRAGNGNEVHSVRISAEGAAVSFVNVTATIDVAAPQARDDRARDRWGLGFNEAGSPFRNIPTRSCRSAGRPRERPTQIADASSADRRAVQVAAGRSYFLSAAAGGRVEGRYHHGAVAPLSPWKDPQEPANAIVSDRSVAWAAASVPFFRGRSC